jgi:hypothetical protein
MPLPAGKLRTRAHVLADLSINHVERQVLRCGFSVERVQHDYGYDLTMTTYHSTGEVEPGPIYIQVKATDRLPRVRAGSTISWLVSRRDLKLWLNEAYPVVLVVYDGKRDNAYWINIQAHFSTGRAADLFADSETICVHLPVRNRLKSRTIRAIARQKNILHAKLRGK